MRTIFAVVLLLYSAAAMAQTSPPTVGGKPLVQVKPSGEGLGAPYVFVSSLAVTVSVFLPIVRVPAT